MRHCIQDQTTWSVLMDINPLPHNPDLTILKGKASENIVGKGENAGNHNVFYTFQNKFQFFSHILSVISRCFQFWPVSNFVVW